MFIQEVVEYLHKYLSRHMLGLMIVCYTFMFFLTFNAEYSHFDKLFFRMPTVIGKQLFDVTHFLSITSKNSVKN